MLQSLHSEKSKGKIFAIGIVILVLFGGLGSYYLGKQSQISTLPIITSSKISNWKTFTGDAFGTKFTFLYPPGLTLKFKGSEGVGTVFVDRDGLELLTIYYVNKSSSQNLKSFSTEAATNPTYGGGKQLLRQSIIKVADQEAFKNEVKTENNQLKFQVFVPDQKRSMPDYDNLYNIQNTNATILSESDFDQILSTFKFLE